MSSSDTATPKLISQSTVSVRWRDLDAFNHVNNSIYLTYLEEARLEWLQRLPGEWMNAQGQPVMAASEINYRQPISWPSTIQVELLCERIGHSSMVVGHRIVDAADPSRLYCDGRVVMVWMDPTTGKSTPLPPIVRDIAAG